ncbi:TPA: hypothetical protein ACN8NN_002807 [Escherichia coli]|nr:hypothetical protein [Escherichia coli]
MVRGSGPSAVEPKVLCVIVGISFSLMLVALFLSLAWVMLSSSGLLG